MAKSAVIGANNKGFLFCSSTAMGAMTRIILLLLSLLLQALVLCVGKEANVISGSVSASASFVTPLANFRISKFKCTHSNTNRKHDPIHISVIQGSDSGATAATAASTRHNQHHHHRNTCCSNKNSCNRGSTTSSLAYSSGRVNDVGSDTYDLGLKPVFYKRNRDDKNGTNAATDAPLKSIYGKNRNIINDNDDMNMILKDVQFSLQKRENTKIVDRILLSTPKNNQTKWDNESDSDSQSRAEVVEANPQNVTNINDNADGSNSTTKQATLTGPGTDDLSTLASSIMDAFIDAKPKQGFRTVLVASNNSNNKSNATQLPLGSTQLGPTQLDSYAQDLYSLAASMTKPPKMKRTKPASQSLQSSSPVSQQFVPQPTISLSSSKSMKNNNIKVKSTIDPNTPLTVADLQQILNDNGYIRRDDLSNITSSKDLSLGQQQHHKKTQNKTTSSGAGVSGSVSSSASSTKKKKTKSGLAFPQSSILSPKHISIGTSISSSIFSMLIAISLQPNLWLIGSIVGAILGNDIAVKTEKFSALDKDGDVDDDVPPIGGLYGDICLKLGKRIATVYLKFWDFVQGVWFMYRTGQLSYEYYKTYATLDDKFKIQDKMDAWNARFVEGKKNFDQWERENEIGRKVLAGLRTVWMLEENSYKTQKYLIDGREKKRSKYRLVQYAIDVGFWFRKVFTAIWDAVTGGGTSELTEMLRGVKIQIRELNTEIISQRMGAAMAALLAVNIVGALFAVAPYLLGVIAVLSGMIWPNWLGSGYQRIKTIVEDTRARGRGEKKKKQINVKTTRKQVPLIDRRNFHFFVKEDGRKQWYRTGQSMFSKFEEEKSNNFFNFKFFNDEDKKEKKKYWL